MTVGLSHSGKTTLAKSIVHQFSVHDIQHIDTDTIRAMCHHHIPEIYHNKRSGDVDIAIPEKYKNKLSLIDRIQHTLLEYVMDFDKNIILSNGNTYRQGRQKIYDLLKKNGYTIIMIYVNTEEELIFERLRSNTTKDPALMLKSKNYQESYRRQKSVFETPTLDEADYFLRYNGVDQSNVLEQLSTIIEALSNRT